MRAPWILLLTLAAAPAFAAEPAAGDAPMPEPFRIRSIQFGAQAADSDTESSRFREYRALPSGFVLTSLRFAGNERFRYDVQATNALQADARYSALLEPGPFEIDFAFQRIRHRFGNDGRALLTERPRGVFVLSDTLQQAHQDALERQRAGAPASVNFAFLRSLIDPSIEAASRIDLMLTRDRGHLTVRLSPEESVLDVHATYSQERRSGNRAAGTAFGFGSVVETAEPIEFRTHEAVGVAEWARSWGLVRGGVRYSRFENAHLTQAFDNPFRITDSTDSNAYQAPGAGSIGGPRFGMVSLSPENESLTGMAGVQVRPAKKTRVSADVSLSRWTQSSPFMPFSTNTAITAPVVATDLAALPARSLDGRIDVLSLSLSATSRPTERLGLTARYRRYDLDNKTRRVEFPLGYVRFDAVWEDIPRVSVPYGNATDRAELSADYDLGRMSLEAGYRLDVRHRTFREAEKTTENTLFGALRWRPRDWAVLRVGAETGKRDLDGTYHAAEAEHHSFLEPGPATNLPGLRRYDIANRDSRRLTALLQLTPGGNTTIAVSYVRGNDDYRDSTHGLLDAESDVVSADVDYSPGERWGVFAFAARENLRTFQRGRQSGATPSTREIDDWTSDVEDEVDTVGGGLRWNLVKEKADLTLSASYQRVNGHNDLDSPPGGTPDVAVDIADFDDTKWLTLAADVAYQASRTLRVSVGGWLEDYELRDAQTSRIATYLPGSIFMAANDADFRGHVLYTRATYTW
jgi:MtrB/PioB family decaheme-associated outer membrane protein